MNGEKQRQLQPAYQFNHETFVWSCSECAKMFFVAVAEAEPGNAPRHILSEFASHFCMVPYSFEKASPQREDFEDIVIRVEKDAAANNERRERE